MKHNSTMANKQDKQTQPTTKQSNETHKRIKNKSTKTHGNQYQQ